MIEEFLSTTACDSKGLLTALVTRSEDAIIAHDLEGLVHGWSEGAARLFGYEAAEMNGRSLAVLLGKGQEAEFRGILDRVATGQRIETSDATWIARDGRQVHVRVTICPAAGAEGAVAGALILAHDITEWLRADLARRTTEARWRAIIDSAVDGIVVIDQRGRITTFNRAAEEMFGYREADVVGQNVNMLMPAPYREEHDGYIDSYVSTGHRKIIGIGREVSGRRADGSEFPIHLSVGEVQVDNERHFTGILHDLTARVALEDRMREQTALARLGEMAAVIAHEVKNPLAAVRGAIQVIGGRLPADSRDAPVVKEIVARLDGLNDLINDLLLFARAPTPRLATVDLALLLRLTVDLLMADPALKGVGVKMDGSAEVRADAELLKIVLQNLLLNAAQAIGGHGTIRASILPGGQSCQVVIADDGPGIPLEVRNTLFRPFVTTKARGTGLGLPTAKRLVEAQGGSIGVECPPTGGTVVTIHLPYA